MVKALNPLTAFRGLRNGALGTVLLAGGPSSLASNDSGMWVPPTSFLGVADHSALTVVARITSDWTMASRLEFQTLCRRWRRQGLNETPMIELREGKWQANFRRFAKVCDCN